MERRAGLTEAREIMGYNFAGPEELAAVANRIGIVVPNELPEIPFSIRELEERKEDYLLICGASRMKDGSPVSLLSLRDQFGIDPAVSEPCFYNQDWYLKESFINLPLQEGWYLIRKSVRDDTRGRSPEELSGFCIFPPAVVCAYVFFARWFLRSECLWIHDFVWCNDRDGNGDRIYVGRYEDRAGISKNGFSIHRHLSIRDNYGSL